MADPAASPLSKLRLALAQLPYLPRAFALVWSAAGPWTAAWLGLLVAQGLLPPAAALLTREVVNGLVAALSAPGDWAVLGGTLGLVALMAVVLLLTEVLSSLAGWVRTAQGELVQDHVHDRIHAQALRLDLGFYETPEYYDRLHRARVDAIHQPVSLLENAGRMAQNGIALAAMAGLLAAYAWWLPPALLAGALPALWVAGRHTWRFHRWRVRSTPHERRTRYYDWLITWPQAAAELRLFDLGGHFQSAFQSLRRKLRSERLDLARRQMLAELGAGTAGLTAMGLTMAWLARRGLAGEAGLGDLVLFYQVFGQGQRLMRALLDGAGETYRSALFIGNLFEFLSLAPGVADPAEPAAIAPVARGEVRIESVTFRYPGNSRAALVDFSLALPAGQVVAVVGENGAGKSTLIKLLCRFYDSEAGRITVDGVDLRRMPLADLRRQITVLFQEPVHYHDTAAQNIAFGDLAAGPTREEIMASARAAGADAPVRGLPEGYDTVLGKWFGGVELSVGEWQRIALARAFVRQASIVVLDEPTSAMDSWAEVDWMARFRELVAGRTALVITHRFTTALKADVIHVMAEGHLAESGTHAELVALGGRYARSWREQMQGPSGGNGDRAAVTVADAAGWGRTT